MRRFNLLNLSIMGVMILAGCGGGGGSSTPTIKRGYYIDSAVEGVEFNCGTQTGTTGENGEFQYEEGEECTFSVAGIPLRDVPVEDLGEEVRIFENDPHTARFLQSIDNDGNATNGIQISEDTRTLLEREENSVPTGDRLTTIVSEIDASSTTFDGHVVDTQSVNTHLNQTTRTLLAGHTYYAYDEGEGIPTIYSVTFNSDASRCRTVQQDYYADSVPGRDLHEEIREGTIEILGGGLIRYHGEEEELTLRIHSTSLYISIVAMDHSEIERLYSTREAAIAGG